MNTYSFFCPKSWAQYTVLENSSDVKMRHHAPVRFVFITDQRKLGEYIGNCRTCTSGMEGTTWNVGSDM